MADMTRNVAQHAIPGMCVSQPTNDTVRATREGRPVGGNYAQNAPHESREDGGGRCHN